MGHDEHNTGLESEMTLVPKSLLHEWEQRARVYYPSIDLQVLSIDQVMFQLWSGKSNKELSPVVSRNEIFAILKSLCNTAREEMCGL